MSTAPHINESRHALEHGQDVHVKMEHDDDESCHTHINESCHAYINE